MVWLYNASLPTATILEGRTWALVAHVLPRVLELMMHLELSRRGAPDPSSWLRRQKGNLAQYLQP